PCVHRRDTATTASSEMRVTASITMIPMMFPVAEVVWPTAGSGVRTKLVEDGFGGTSSGDGPETPPPPPHPPAAAAARAAPLASTNRRRLGIDPFYRRR